MRIDSCLQTYWQSTVLKMYKRLGAIGEQTNLDRLIKILIA